MLERRASSRDRYTDYNKRRRSDATWAKRGKNDLEPRPDRLKRSRPFRELFFRFWSLTAAETQSGSQGAFAGHRPYIYLALFTLTIMTVVGLAIPAFTKLAIDGVLTEPPRLQSIPRVIRDWIEQTPDRMHILWVLGATVLILSLISVSVGIIGRWQMTRVTKRLQADLRRIAFRHAAQLPLHRIHHYKSGGMASLLRDDAGQSGELLFNMIYNPWRAIVQLSGTLLILAWVDWRLLVGGLLLVPVVWLTHRTWIARIRPLFRDSKLIRQAVDATTTEAFGGVRVVRGFSRERAEGARFTIGQHYMTRIEILSWWWSRLLEMAWSVLIPAASAAVLIYGGSQVIRHRLTIGDVMMFSTYLLMLLGPLETLTSSATNIQTNLAALDRVLDLLAEDPEFGGRNTGLIVTKDSSRGHIELRDVWFTYPRPARPSRVVTGPDPKNAKPDSAKPPPHDPGPVIRGVTLTARAGETIALVGPSGSGKTTLCNLIARFYDPTQGRILFDNIPLPEIDVSSYRSLLGIVEQDVFLFDGTIADNIAYGRRDATIDNVRDAARSANADGFISQLERGYETVIGERGVRLSGGQKQRIAIARAILADPRILILDEATSNLDTESELLIQRSLATLMRGRTSFVIAHRLSTVRNADRIVVLEHGAIIEEGSHQQLLDRPGRYAELLRLQVEGIQPNHPATSNGHPAPPANGSVSV